MSNKVVRVCNKPGCCRLTENGYCELHKKERKPDKRPSAYKRGYTPAWQRASKAYLIKHPFCVECLKKGVHKRSEVVDHIKPHKGDRNLFWDSNNWQALCKQCHDRKTVIEDGGFGRPVHNK